MEVFGNELTHNLLFSIALLREVMGFYDASPLTHDYLAKMRITNISRFDRNHQFHFWLGSMYNLSREKVNQICTA